MRIALRLMLGFFLVLGLALFVVLRVFVDEVQPGTRLAMEDSLIDAAFAYAQLAEPDMQAGRMASGAFAQAMAKYQTAKPGAELWGFRKDRVDTRITIADAHGRVVFDTRGEAVGQDHSQWNDVFKTLRGEYGARSSPLDPHDPKSTVMHVAAPIRDGERIIGVLTVSRPNQLLEPYIDRSRQRILLWSWVLLGVSLLLGLLFSWWMASSLSRLRGYAHAVAAGERAELPRMGKFSGHTEFHDLAQAVERMRLRLEDKAYVENYVHTLTHELKSPLAGIRGAAELLQEALPDADRQRFAANIERQTERLQHLIDKLLRLADVEQIRHLTAAERVNVSALTRELLAAAEPRCQRKGLSIKASLGDGVGVQGDSFLIAQALQNLIDNAIEFAPANSVISVNLSAGSAGVTWRIQDQGPGVPDYALGRIFERFYSLARGDAQEKSSGLGLCLVQEVMALHGGSVSVENAVPGPGCVATLRWPGVP
jgi:two-component system, OmpR family, sensor histidine kinase CreC